VKQQIDALMARGYFRLVNETDERKIRASRLRLAVLGIAGVGVVAVLLATDVMGWWGTVWALLAVAALLGLVAAHSQLGLPGLALVARQYVTLAGAVVIVLLAGFAIFQATELHSVHVGIEPWEVPEGDVARTVVIGRRLQILFVGLASFLPALMYFQYDRERSSAVRRRLYGDVFRMDPSIRTEDELEARYGRQLEAAFGSTDSSQRRDPTLRSGRRTPVLVATAVLAIGWAVIALTTPPHFRRARG
jgi:hypothetical protein